MDASDILQKQAYVVQRCGDRALSKEGKLVDRDFVEAHIPYEEYTFIKTKMRKL